MPPSRRPKADAEEVRPGVPRIAPGLATLAVPISSVQFDPHNARLHPDENIETIKWSLGQYGQQKPIVVMKDGTVKAGNGTLRAAREMGWTQIAAVVFSGGDEQDAERFALVDNKAGDLAKWDYAVLQDRFADADAELLGSMGWKDHEIEMILAADFKPGDAMADDGEEKVEEKGKTLDVSFPADTVEMIERAAAFWRARAVRDDAPMVEALLGIIAEWSASNA